MNKNSIYFHVTETENELIIDDRLEVSWKEIILYPFPFFLALIFLKEYWFVVLPLFLLISLGYLFFRFFAWLFYKKIKINKINKNIEEVHFFLNRKRSYTLIDTMFSIDNISFLKEERSGDLKFILRYTNYKNYDLLVVKSIEDKSLLEKYFSKL